MARITCPRCRQSSEAPASFLGRSVRCRGCGEQFKADVAPTIDMPAMPSRLPGPVVAAPVPAASSETKLCVFCGERIQAQALKCRYCSEYLDPVLRASVVVSQAPPPSTDYQRYDRPIDWASVRPAPQPKQQVISQTVVVQGGGSRYQVPHVLHAFLTLITFGLWLPIWILHTLLNDHR